MCLFLTLTQFQNSNVLAGRNHHVYQSRIMSLKNIFFKNSFFQVVYVAKRNIEEGDQVTDCYGIHHLYMGLQERQAALLKGYAFKCDCIACTKNHGMLGQLPASVAPKIGVKLGTTMTK